MSSDALRSKKDYEAIARLRQETDNEVKQY
jgi:hypothetical protein